MQGRRLEHGRSMPGMSPGSFAGKAVAVVSDGVYGAVAPLAHQIRERGGHPVLLTAEPTATKLEAWRDLYARVVVIPEIGDAGALADAACRATDGRGLAGLFSCFDGLCLPAARAAEQLGLPHPDLDGLAIARDKGATRLALERHGVPSIRARRLESIADVAPASRAVGFPAVIKPVDGSASHFVRRVDDEAELERAYESGRRRLVDSWPTLHGHGEGVAAQFLLEEYLTGAEYTLELVVGDGQVRRVAAFDKFIVDEDGFLECAFASPFVRGNGRTATDLWEYVQLCVSAVGVDDTVAHVEVMVTEAGPRLIEINAGRPCGQILPRAVLDLTGVDLLGELLSLQTGMLPPLARPPTITGQVATYTVFPSRSGRVSQINGLETLARHEHVVDVIPYCSVGDWVDVEDKEFFALNVLTAGLRSDELVPFYDLIRRTVEVVVES